ncbi:unnamed protein product [Rotaria socialis]
MEAISNMLRYKTINLIDWYSVRLLDRLIRTSKSKIIHFLNIIKRESSASLWLASAKDKKFYIDLLNIISLVIITK